MRRWCLTWLALALALLLAGCATPYGRSGWTGGYWDKPGPGELIEVGFDGNGLIDVSTVDVYLLYRCAELTRQHGKDYFSMYATIADAIRDRPIFEVSATALGGKPISKVYVLLQDGQVPGALAADQVMARYSAQVRGTAQPKGHHP